MIAHLSPEVSDRGRLALMETPFSGEPVVATSYVDVRDYGDHLKLVSGGRRLAWAQLVSLMS